MLIVEVRVFRILVCFVLKITAWGLNGVIPKIAKHATSLGNSIRDQGEKQPRIGGKFLRKIVFFAGIALDRNPIFSV